MNFCCECGCALGEHAYQGRGEPFLCPNGHLNTPPGPKILVSCFINCGERLLWMRRAHAPQQGFWAIPAGFMEAGETLREAAARELREETGVLIAAEQLQPYMIGSISFISEVYIAFRASVDSTDCQCGPEALDVGFFSRGELDWGNVAYPSANQAIEQAYTDSERNRFGLYHGLFTKDENRLELVQDIAEPGKD